MSRSYSLLVSLCVVSSALLCWKPTVAFELRQTSSSLCSVSTPLHITPNNNAQLGNFQHRREARIRYHQRQLLYTTTSLFAQSDNFSAEEENREDLPAAANNNKKSSNTISRRQRLRNKLSRITKTLLLASALTVALPKKEAHAKFSHELKEERTLSLRPGVSQEHATQLDQGEIPEDLPETPKTNFLQTKDPPSSTTDKKKSVAKKNKKTFDYGDEDEDDDFDEENDYFLPSKTTAGRKGVAQADVKKAEAFQAGTKSSFSGVAKKSETEKRVQTLKVGVGAFIPTFGAMFVREFVRRRKEETYVQKGLEILEAQKAEYFNITATTADSDIEDELKDLKDDEDDEEDDDDEDDEDDDDDDDDDEDEEPPSRRPPKRPTGGGGSGGGGSGSGGDGDGRPSEDDLKRLGDIFNKS